MNSKFTNNIGTAGGAISVAGFAYISNCLLFNNSAQYGGAVFVQNAGLEIEFSHVCTLSCFIAYELSIFKIWENTASYGGAIYFDCSQSCDFTCTNDPSSQIELNVAIEGGAIAIAVGNVNANANKPGPCFIVGNIAKSGGGVLVNGTSANLDNFILQTNIAETGGKNSSLISSISYMITGAISVIAGRIAIEATNISTNIGGGLYAIVYYVYLSNTNFFENVASDLVCIWSALPVCLLVFYSQSSTLDLALFNSSSQLANWNNVTVTSSDAFTCNDCTGKFCTAAATCSDCGYVLPN